MYNSIEALKHWFYKTGYLLALTCLAIWIAGVSLTFAQSKNKGAQTINPVLAGILVRDILTAVNHANWTGNYSVLRDLASPNFSSVNDPTRLASIFQPIRAERLDLLPVLGIVPILEKNIVLQPGNQVHLTGFFPTLPRYIRFDMLFEPIANRWRLLGIAVSTSAPTKVAQQVAQKPPIISQKDEGARKTATPKSRNNQQKFRIPLPKFRPRYFSD